MPDDEAVENALEVLPDPDEGAGEPGDDDPLAPVRGRTPEQVDPAVVADVLATEGVDEGDLLAAMDVDETAVREDADAGADAGGDETDEAYETDDRAERFGYYAGGAVTAVAVLLLFVGPWRLFDVTFGGDLLPLAVRDTTGLAALAVLVAVPVCALLFGAVTAALYRATTADPAESYQLDVALGTFLVPVVVGVVGYVLVWVVVAGGLLLDGDVVGAAVALVFAVLGGFVFTTAETIAVALYLGLPTVVGTYTGGLLGGLVAG